MHAAMKHAERHAWAREARMLAKQGPVAPPVSMAWPKKIETAIQEDWPLR